MEIMYETLARYVLFVVYWGMGVWDRGRGSCRLYIQIDGC